jgi:hypothetical protein
MAIDKAGVSIVLVSIVVGCRFARAGAGFGMDYQDTIKKHIEEIEQLARGKGLSRRQWLIRSKVSASTWYRWRQGKTLPSGRIIRRLSEAAERFCQPEVK